MRLTALSIFIVLAVGAFGYAWASDSGNSVKKSFVDKVYKISENSSEGVTVHFYQQPQIYIVKDAGLLKKLRQQMTKKGRVFVEAHPFERTILKVDVIK